ncbi:transporter substrate-binding domain-containing protein [Pantoea sp. 1.19]|uniref:transporter substrate-binding domain-containing protein n=1 Tax=Pantoea sp. 1.19 TaxID=1925589 RepID=UPI000948C2C8|nr:transporter substrate-binding domain-containing protein [Pantoea sp. 1.19]
MNKCLFVILALLSTGAQAASHLDSVLASKTLKVCATGDYKPYTYLRPDGRWEGIDAEMMTRLAATLGAEVRWVQTSWKTLMADFEARQCDIAVGGISVTLPRQQRAWFATPLDTDGKIPLVRCEESAKYRTVEQLNRPEVRLIEPAGGTNEAFVRQHLPRAHLTLFHDNVTIFQVLADGRADVMITDASEAQYQAKRFPSLCALAPQRPLQYGEKAYMLPRDDASWKAYLDQWIHLSKATGEYPQVVGHWLAR